MKKNIQTMIKAATLMLLPMAFVACQSEQEVGTPLYPETGDNASQIAFVDNHAYGLKNHRLTAYAQAGSSAMLDIPTDTLKFYVQLTVPAEKDLAFKLKVDNAKLGKDLGDSYVVVDEEALKFETASVTVKQGQMKSEMPFRIVLNDKSKQLLELGEAKKGLVAFTFESLDGIKISDKYNSYVWELNKEILWVNPKGSVDKLQTIDVQKYTVNCGYYGAPGSALSDGDITNFAKYMITENAYSYIKIDFKEETEFSALQLTPTGFIGGENLGNYFIKEVEIQGSSDGNTYSKLGVAVNSKAPTDKQEPWNIVFYSAQKVKSIRMKTVSTFQSSEIGSAVFLSELKVLK